MKGYWIALMMLWSQPGTFAQTIAVHDEFRKYFDECKVTGSFALLDLHNNKYTFCNTEQFNQKFTPASTFKICNSLIGLETGAIPDENYVIRWDGVKREREPWNQDHDLKTAYKNSTVWYYQELARRVGGARMKMWLTKAHYGNEDTSGGIDQFWLAGGLRITPRQQIDFLKRLFEGKLPFSKRSMDIVKKIMIEEETPEYTLRAKTGWGQQDGKDIGWYVGYVTKNDNVYFFETCIQTEKADNDFTANRRRITKKILKSLQIFPDQSPEQY